MTRTDIAPLRQHHLRIDNTKPTNPAAIVRHLGAMQAQDFPGTLWALGLRIPGATTQTILEAVTSGAIVRTWPQRGTLHFVAPEEVRWRLQLSTPRILKAAKRRHENLQLNEAIFGECKKLFSDALQGGKCLTRSAMMELLESHNISTKNQRGYHILWYCAQTGHIIFGPSIGAEQTFVLLDEWVAPAPPISTAEALAKLVKSYFTSHGPATLQDLAWWSGQTMSDLKTGLAAVMTDLVELHSDGKIYYSGKDSVHAQPGTYLLPGFDEYLLGYRDRTPSLDALHFPKIVPGSNGMFTPTVVIDGKVEGTWKRLAKKDRVIITITPFISFTKAQQQAIAKAADRYSQFIEQPVEVVF